MSEIIPIVSDSMSSVSGDTYQSMDSINKSSNANSRKSTPLPFDFMPSYNDILCGRGAECLNHIGNQRFRQLIDDNLELYIHTKTKTEKSIIIREIVKRIRNQSLPSGFIRKDLLTGQYFEVGEFSAREKTSQAFRDALAHKSRSESMLKPQQQHLHSKSTSPLISKMDPNHDFPKHTIDLKMNVKRPFVSAHMKNRRLFNIIEERNAKISEQQGQQHQQQQKQHQMSPSNDASIENVRIINSFINNVSTSDFANVSTSDFATTAHTDVVAARNDSGNIGYDSLKITSSQILGLELEGDIPNQHKFDQYFDMKNINHQRYVTETQRALPDFSLSEQSVFKSPKSNIYNADANEISAYDHNNAFLLQPIQLEGSNNTRNHTIHANNNIQQHHPLSVDSINYNSCSNNCNINFNEQARLLNDTLINNPTNNSPSYSQRYTQYVASMLVRDTNQEVLANPYSSDHLTILALNQTIGEQNMNEKQVYHEISEQHQQHQLPDPMLYHLDQYTYNDSRYGTNSIEGNSASRTAVINERNISSSEYIIPEDQSHRNYFHNNVCDEWRSNDESL